MRFSILALFHLCIFCGQFRPSSAAFKSCYEILLNGDSSSGIQVVHPNIFCSLKVLCDQTTDGGGWTVIQSRSPLPVRENFTRNWNEYVGGFGELSGEFWFGLQNIHSLTSSTQMELRIDLEDDQGQKRWANYRTFHVGDAGSKYTLTIANYSAGDAGDGMNFENYKEYHLNGMKFSTYDADNDNSYSSRNCAEEYKGGWWFNDCRAAHLNGLPIVGEDNNSQGITWWPFRGLFVSLKKGSMKIRPVSGGF